MSTALKLLTASFLIGCQPVQMATAPQDEAATEKARDDEQTELPVLDGCQPGDCPRDLYEPYEAFVRPTTSVTSVMPQRYNYMGDTLNDFEAVELQSGDPNDLRYWNLVVTLVDGSTAALQMLVVNEFALPNHAGPYHAPWLLVRSFAWISDDTASVELCIQDVTGINACRTFESTYE